MSSRRLILLGSTGSIGVSTVEVLQHLRAMGEASFEVVGLAAGSNASLLAEQARALGVRELALADASAAAPLASLGNVRSGPDAALRLVEDLARPGDVLVAAMVGFAGLASALRAIELGCHVALANKETLVAAGEIVTEAARRKGVQLFPIDSEHSALAQCIRSGRIDELDRVVITASGGPFRTWSAERTRNATVQEALRHPTWQMGRKITIDSATLMNKALEIIEAHWLFGLPAERIDAIAHPQSIVHGFAEFRDGSVIAQLSPPDMKLPIQMALTWPARHTGVAKRLDWTNLKSLEFEPIDHARFPAVRLAHQVIRRGGSAGATLNAANEVAVQAFLDGHIAFGQISDLVEQAMRELPDRALRTLQDAQDADAAARAFIRHRTGAVTLGT
ncbi:MAG: 1-deoxy-D-xylulose-5-phosphate reductoisomerase [Planctomycetes bacterium]|nr:1-deoxy-D-xylulose-5-phosphate reductoisomerase [Planctomycetota bacterium]